MKKPILFLGALCAISTAFAQDAAATKAAADVTMKEGTFWPSYEVAGKYFSNGTWTDSNLPSDPTELASIVSNTATPPEVNLQNLFDTVGYNDEENIAYAMGYISIDAARITSLYGSWDGLAQHNGFPSYNDLVNEWWGGDPGYTSVAETFGLLTANVTQMYADAEVSNLQEYANKYYGQLSVPPVISQDQINEFAARISEIPPDTFQSLLSNSPDANTPTNTVMLQKAIADGVSSGALTSAGWTETQIQNALFTTLVNAGYQNPDAGALFAQMDYSGLDLTNRSLLEVNLQGSNITGTQLNQAATIEWAKLPADITGLDLTGKSIRGTDLTGTNITGAQLNQASVIEWATLSGLNLSELNTTGKSFYGTNFTNTNITTAQLNQAANLEQSNLSGLNLTGLNLTGKSVMAVNLTGTNITGAQLSQATNIQHTNLTGLNLSGLNLTGKSLLGTNLSNTNITGAQVSQTTGIRMCNLSGTNLTGIDLTGKDILGANFSNTTGLTATNISGAQWITNINFQGSGITRALLDAARAARIAAGLSTPTYQPQLCTF